MTVTIKDVAKASGYSVASVSRALNGHDSVTVEARERILDAVDRLRYMPNSAARSLVTRRTQTIGALLPDLYGAFFSELIRGIDLAARARGLHLLVSSSHGDAAEAAATLRAMRGRVDGMLVMSPYADDDFLADNLPRSLPLVLMGTRAGDGRHACIGSDNYGGARAMTRHLHACGHRRIAFIDGPRNNVEAQERRRGYVDALAKLAPPQKPICVAGDFTEESGYLAARKLLAMKPRPDAVFAANDMMAVGCLYAFQEAGLDVPRDIALAGFDDIPIARYLSPTLTTVRVRIADLGREALERLVAQMDQENTVAAVSHTLDCEVVVRNSCGGAVGSTRSKSSKPHR
jgi:LacI family transcriptional regulator